MAVAVMYEFPGMTQEHYERIMREAFQDHLALGVMTHAAGPMDGGWWAMDAYESQAVADRIGGQLGPGPEQMGVTQAPRMTPRKVHNVLPKG